MPGIEMQSLTSLQNETVKHFLGLQEKARKRKQTQSFVVEGQKEIEHAIANGYRVLQLWIREGQQVYKKINYPKETSLFTVPSRLFERLCYRKNTTQIMAVFQMKKHQLNDFSLLDKKGLLLVAEAPEKPGNIGALLRTCDALGSNGLLVVNPKTDLYNPNVIRSSVGCLFGVQWACCSMEEAFAYFVKNKIVVYSAALTEQSKIYTEIKYPPKVAIAVGSEHSGLSKAWLGHNEQHPIQIPMQGINDSLNVSVAAGIIMSEIVRQQNQ